MYGSNGGDNSGYKLGVVALKLVTVHLPEEFLRGLAELVRQRRYPNRSEAIRLAIRDMLKEELWGRAV